MSRERRAETILIVLMLAGVAVVLWRTPAEPEPVRLTALGAVPEDVVLLVTVNADALRQSEWGESVLTQGRNLQGLGAIDELCQDSPLQHLKELALFVPTVKSDEPLDVGVVAQGSFDLDLTLACVERVVRARGGDPIRSKLGSFSSVRDRGSTRGEIALRRSGPLLLGEGRTLRVAVDTAEGRNPNVRNSEAHSGLRHEVGEHALVMSLLLPPGWLTRMTGLEVARASPLAQVRAAAIGVDFAPVKIDVVLGCEAENLATEVARILIGFSKDPGGLIELDLGRNPLENAKIVARGRTVRMQLALGPEDLRVLSRKLFGQLNPTKGGEGQLPVEPVTLDAGAPD